MLDDISVNDRVKRLRVGMKLAEDAQKEIRYMADTLLELIPTNAPLPEGK